jgi:hypothetical protein
VSARHGLQIERAIVEKRPEFALLDQAGCFQHDFSVVLPSLAAQQRQQRENSGIGPSLEGERRERVLAPAEAADDMAESAHRNERCIQHFPAAGIVDEVKSPALGATLYILLDAFARVIDRCRTEGANVAGLGGTRGRIDFRTKGSGDLNGDMTDASLPPCTSTW